MNSRSDAEDSDTDSRDILNRAIPPSNMSSKSISGGPVARLYCKNRFEYFMNKTRVLVGRSGGESKTDGPEVDISIDSCSLYISRRHFDIFTTDCSKFFVSVYSKNGLFVNGFFIRKGSAAFQLKNQSRLRFPKTDLKILFQLLEKDPQMGGDNNHNIPLVVSGENGDHSTEAQPNLQASFQSYNILPQHHKAVNEEPDTTDSFMLPSAVTSTKLERETFRHHATQSQSNKKRKFRDTEMAEGAANSHPSQSHDWGSRGDYADGRKPPFSYSQLIAQAIFSAPDHMLCLNDIYMFITKTYPFYKPEDKGWQNSIRHNLSLSKSFVRLPRANEEGKGSLWSIEYSDKQTLLKTAYKPRGTRDKYNQPPPAKIPRVVAEPNVGDSEDSGEVPYQNEDEEAANNIAMSTQASSESFSFGGGDQYGEGDADQHVKTPQAAILQSSFANPMQIFMQPDRRGNLNQQHINLAQIQRANVTGSGSVQVVRLTVNPNNTTEMNYGGYDAAGQQEQLDIGAGILDSNQESQVWQHQQLRLQQQPQVTGTGQRIIILRPAQQQQVSSDPNMSVGTPATVVQQAQPKKILLTSSVGSGAITILNAGNTLNKDHGQIQRIVITQPQLQQTQMQEDLSSGFSLENQGSQLQSQTQQASIIDDAQQSLQFEILSAEQQQQVLIEQLLQQKQQQGEAQLLHLGQFEAQSEDTKEQIDEVESGHLEHLSDHSKEAGDEVIECASKCQSESNNELGQLESGMEGQVQEKIEADHPNEVPDEDGKSREIPIMEFEENS